MRIALSAVEQQLVALAMERREPAMRAFLAAVAPVVDAHADSIPDKHAPLSFEVEDGVIVLVVPEATPA